MKGQFRTKKYVVYPTGVVYTYPDLKYIKTIYESDNIEFLRSVRGKNLDAAIEGGDTYISELRSKKIKVEILLKDLI